MAGLDATIAYFLKLTIVPEVVWHILPLFIATAIILTYFEKYRDEREEWGSYLSNSLVLMFVAIGLFRHIYTVGIPGFDNLITYTDKSIAAVFLLFIGWILLKFNFEHLLPRRFARHLSSVLTLHLLAYATILYVYSDLGFSWIVVLALLVLIIAISAILNLIRLPLKKLFAYTAKVKARERVENVKEARYELDELKRELKTRKRELEKIEVGQLEKQKKEAVRLKKIIKKRS
mgnify:CR=1 FL=1